MARPPLDRRMRKRVCAAVLTIYMNMTFAVIYAYALVACYVASMYAEDDDAQSDSDDTTVSAHAGNPSLLLEEGEEVDGSGSQTSVSVCSGTKRASHAASSSSKQPRSKRQKCGQGMEITTLVSELGKLRSFMQGATEDIKELTSCFKDERDIVEKRSKIYEELCKIEGLTDYDRFAVGRKIIKDNNKVEYFFSIPEDMRRAYVLSLLIPDL